MNTVAFVIAVMAVLLLAIGLIKPALLKDNRSGETPSRKNIAAGTFLMLLIAAVMHSCSDDEPANPAVEAKKAEAAVPSLPAQPFKPVAHYSLKENQQYGYEPALTDEDKTSGKVSVPLIMFKFSGERDGVYQAYTSNGRVHNVIECSGACEFLKVMTFFGSEHIKTERMRRVDGAIGSLVMSDAMDELLEPYKTKRNGKLFNVWWDEAQGLIYSEVVDGPGN
jgi:hypothetical protein